MELIRKYFPEFTENQFLQFEKFKNLILEWNEKINLISRKNTDQVEVQHILHSLAIIKVIRFKANTKILDVGSGGGFPGIPLAIAFPDVEFTFVDSIQKKMIAVEDMVQNLGLKNVKVIHGRAEKVSGKFDFITARAVAKTEKIYNWTRKKVNKKPSGNDLANGYLLLKGGNLQEELEIVQLPFKSFAIIDFFADDFFETKHVIYLAA